MNPLTRRRGKNVALAALGIALAALAWRAADRALLRGEVYAGYGLYAAVLLLAAYNLRKRFPGLPLGPSWLWMQTHIYLGLATAPLYLLHAGLRWPDGRFEAMLAGLFAATFVSGLWGLWLSRTLPKQLARAGSQVVFERIPHLRQATHLACGRAVVEAVDQSGATTLADFYIDRLYDFTSRPRALWYQLAPSSARRRQLMRELSDLRRVLSEPESRAAERVFALLRRKDDLDFHQARQGLLKGWLVLHVALSWTLVLTATLHGVLATAFRGDLP